MGPLAKTLLFAVCIASAKLVTYLPALAVPEDLTQAAYPSRVGAQLIALVVSAVAVVVSPRLVLALASAVALVAMLVLAVATERDVVAAAYVVMSGACATVAACTYALLALTLRSLQLVTVGILLASLVFVLGAFVLNIVAALVPSAAFLVVGAALFLATASWTVRTASDEPRPSLLPNAIGSVVEQRASAGAVSPFVLYGALLLLVIVVAGVTDAVPNEALFASTSLSVMPPADLPAFAFRHALALAIPASLIAYSMVRGEVPLPALGAALLAGALAAALATRGGELATAASDGAGATRAVVILGLALAAAASPLALARLLVVPHPRLTTSVAAAALALGAYQPITMLPLRTEAAFVALVGLAVLVLGGRMQSRLGVRGPDVRA